MKKKQGEERWGQEAYYSVIFLKYLSEWDDWTWKVMKHTADIAGLLTIKCCLNYKHKLFSKKKKIYYTKMHRSSTKV